MNNQEQGKYVLKQTGINKYDQEQGVNNYDQEQRYICMRER
jgi:hypothetical protein